MNKLNFLIIFSPFVFTLFYVLVFFLVQQLSNKKYLSKLIYSFILVLLLEIFSVIKFYNLLDTQQIFYILFVFICNSFIFMNLIQIPISSLQVKMLRIISKNNDLNEKKINLKYTPSNIFEERITTFINNETIIKEKSILKLRSKKILFFYVFFKYFKALYNVRL